MNCLFFLCFYSPYVYSFLLNEIICGRYHGKSHGWWRGKSFSACSAAILFSSFPGSASAYQGSSFPTHFCIYLCLPLLPMQAAGSNGFQGGQVSDGKEPLRGIFFLLLPEPCVVPAPVSLRGSWQLPGHLPPSTYWSRHHVWWQKQGNAASREKLPSSSISLLFSFPSPRVLPAVMAPNSPLLLPDNV